MLLKTLVEEVVGKIIKRRIHVLLLIYTVLLSFVNEISNPCQFVSVWRGT